MQKVIESMLSNNINYNKNGELTFAGISVDKLADSFGTPLYAYDEQRIIDNCITYQTAMKAHFGDGSYPIYAGKAASFGYIYKILTELSMSADFVSAGEILTAKRAGFDMSRGFFHGNAKTNAEIDVAIDAEIGCIVVDGEDELFAVAEAARKKNIRQRILLRITPGIDPHTYEAVSTGKVDSKFGMPIKTGQAHEFVRKALGEASLELIGYHCHIGSQVFDDDADVYTDTAKVMLDFSYEIEASLGYFPEYLNLGGGFGVRYTESDPSLDIDHGIKRIADFVKTYSAAHESKLPRFLMEPGRSIVADAGMTVYTVETVKHIPGYKSYVAVDGGMTDNPRYALYRSAYTVYPAEKSNSEMTCDLVGKCCESGDIIQPSVSLPSEIKRGDRVAVATTGAYNYSMASNYNRIPRPAVVMLRGEFAKLVVRRETYTDVSALDIIE